MSAAQHLSVVGGTPSLAQRMATLFAGAEKAYRLKRAAKKEDGKKSKKVYDNVARPASVDDWQTHLDGGDGLVVVPVDREGLCRFGAIDIDDYSLDPAVLRQAVDRAQLPLVPCTSTSGGAHLYAFFSEPTPAEAVRRWLSHAAGELGYPQAEIFPKQDWLDSNGSGINVPHNGKDSDRCMIKTGGLLATVDLFVSVAEEQRLAPEAFGKLVSAPPKTEPADEAAPPADSADGQARLRHWCDRIVQADGGNANNVLARAAFDIARYCRDTDLREEQARSRMLMAWQVRKPDDYSDEFGNVWDRQFAAGTEKGCPATKAGGAEGLPVFERVERIVDDEDVTYYVQIEGKAVRLTPEQLSDQRKFNVQCLTQINRQFCIPRDKNRWILLTNAAADGAEVVEAERIVSTAEQFFLEVEAFVVNRHRAETRDDLLVGRPWEDEKLGRHYFTLVREGGLSGYLARGKSRFATSTPKELARRIRAMGGDNAELTIKGKTLDVFWVPAALFKATPKLDLPPLPKEPI